MSFLKFSWGSLLKITQMSLKKIIESMFKSLKID